MTKRTLALRCTLNPLHVYNRGANGAAIFLADGDYALWAALIADALPKYAIRLLLYSSMPNHYHLSALQERPYEISRFVHDVSWKYAKFFNKKYRRYGPLFASRHQPKIVQDDAGLLRLSHYIHMNPVLAGLCSAPEEWRYSSCTTYFNGSISGMLECNPVLSLVGGAAEYFAFMREYNPGDPFSIHRFMKNGRKGPSEGV